jgi:hypothetical protein
MRNLVYSSVGCENFVDSWNCPQRTFNTAIVWYERSKPILAHKPDFLLTHTGYKFQNFLILLEQFPAMKEHDYILFADDDIRLDSEKVCAIFELARKYQLDACQPSLTTDSVVNWPHTRHKPGVLLEYTNLVEIQCFCLSKRLLEMAMPFFHLIVSGWGLDLIFWELLGKPLDRMAILHSVEVQHPPRLGPRVSERIEDFDHVSRNVVHALKHELGPGSHLFLDLFLELPNISWEKVHSAVQLYNHL